MKASGHHRALTKELAANSLGTVRRATSVTCGPFGSGVLLLACWGVMAPERGTGPHRRMWTRRSLPFRPGRQA